GENVVGLLPGQDATLRHEYMVIGGHIDHCGISAQGHAYFGADDNASGTAVVMELARIFAAQPQRLKRSVLFIGFGGEEQGLRGSQYFAANPTVPAEQICLMFNFDMVGMGNGGGGFGGRNYFPPHIHEIVQNFPDSVRNKLGIYRAWGMGGSDHAHFIEQGIPTFGFFSTGPHPFYHQVEDTPDKINVQSLQFVGDRAAELLEKFANLPGSLLYANQRTGHCFLRFGDQMDFAPAFQTTDIFKQDLKTWVLNYAEHSIRAVVLPLNETATPLEFYHQLDVISQWIKTNPAYLLRFQNGSSLSQAANAGKLAVAIGSQGTAGIGSGITHWRNLFKLGLNFLQLWDASDPLFSGDSLSPFGKSLLTVCQEEQVCLDWTLPDTTRLLNALRDYRGPVIVRWEFPVAARLSPTLRRWFDQPGRLLSVVCLPSTSPAELCQLIDALPSSHLHLAFNVFPSAAADTNDLPAPAQQVQAWYEYRLQGHTKNEVYREMVRLLGDNLKKPGVRDSGRR
ncbi:M28 family peptidase, partial [candidate division KSB1 bacterium]|nr:M28 family peptidase [candidate division KSB1 bacterium]